MAALAKLIATPLLLLIGTIFVVVLAFELLQTGFVFSSEPLRPDFAKLNPGRGLKRLFTVKLLIETAKNVLKLFLYACATWFVIRGAARWDASTFGSVATLGRALGVTSMRLLTIYAGLAAAFAILDQMITRRDFFKRMRMSKREMKQEHRDREGEPRLKQKRKQMHAEFVRGSRSVKGLRGADMLVVNPQHIAIALRYDARAMPAPMITSIGINHLALRLKRLAFIYGIPVIEDRRLARLLLGGAKIDHPIPANSYQPVADLYNRLRRQRAEDIK